MDAEFRNAVRSCTARVPDLVQLSKKEALQHLFSAHMDTKAGTGSAAAPVRCVEPVRHAAQLQLKLPLWLRNHSVEPNQAQ